MSTSILPKEERLALIQECMDRFTQEQKKKEEEQKKLERLAFWRNVAIFGTATVLAGSVIVSLTALLSDQENNSENNNLEETLLQEK